MSLPRKGRVPHVSALALASALVLAGCGGEAGKAGGGTTSGGAGGAAFPRLSLTEDATVVYESSGTLGGEPYPVNQPKLQRVESRALYAKSGAVRRENGLYVALRRPDVGKEFQIVLGLDGEVSNSGTRDLEPEEIGFDDTQLFAPADITATGKRGRVAGLDCRRWRAKDEMREATFCVADDGLILSSETTTTLDGKPLVSKTVALSVTRAPLEAALFEPPTQ
jgi:hypothetical protein